MDVLSVSFVSFNNHVRSCRNISHLGGKKDNKIWKHSLADVINNIQEEKYKYYLNFGEGKNIFIDELSGTKILKTERNKYQQDLLAELPNFPLVIFPFEIIDSDHLKISNNQNKEMQNFNAKDSNPKDVTTEDPNKKNISKPTKEKLLSEVWIGRTENYDEVIIRLKRIYREISHPFINDISGNLNWGKNPNRGWQRYLAGFIFQCNELEFIVHDKFSDREIVAICKNTFQIETLSPDAFSLARSKALD